jgi:hypothetical protein
MSARSRPPVIKRAKVKIWVKEEIMGLVLFAAMDGRQKNGGRRIKEPFSCPHSSAYGFRLD